jgi:cell division protein ZapA
MATSNNVSLDVAIMGREFRVACPEDEREGLLQAVSYLDRKMREIRDGGKVIGLERIAIMAALNITHDYLAARPAQPDTREHRSGSNTSRACLIRPWPSKIIYSDRS